MSSESIFDGSIYFHLSHSFVYMLSAGLAVIIRILDASEIRFSKDRLVTN